MRPGDTLSRDGCLAFLAQRVPGFHVDGKTALDWREIRQSVRFREVLTLWGDEPKRLPAWFTERFSSRYQATQLFDDELPKGLGPQSVPGPGHPDPLPPLAPILSSVAGAMIPYNRGRRNESYRPGGSSPAMVTATNRRRAGLEGALAAAARACRQ